ncbi:MAG: hypothetical protein Q7R34_03325 [Dehalococcoidia bacterium]|nr:hypothetical protein [Dehalococcoidia bacterium]
MPVIRVDNDVWKELQQKAEPLVDTPNTVLRKLLGLDSKKEVITPPRIIEIPLDNLYTSCWTSKWALIPVPKDKRHFFPGYKIPFKLETDIGVLNVKVTSALKPTPVGDPNAGAYITGGLRQWYEKHQELKDGDKVRIELLEPGKRYKFFLA